MEHPVITLTTDFGISSPYVAQMKGVILSLNPRVTLVDITHAIAPQDIRGGAIVLDDVCRWFPADTIHVAVIDPGVGTERALVCAVIGSQVYVAPDNGLLSFVAEREMPSRLIRLAETRYWREAVSGTFHGRDILAPVAAQLSRELDPSSLGPPHEHLVRLDRPIPRCDARTIIGEVISIDSFGNLITNVESSLLPQDVSLETTQVRCGGEEILGILPAYGRGIVNRPVALIGSSGRLEIAIVCGNAARALPARVGTQVTVELARPTCFPGDP